MQGIIYLVLVLTMSLATDVSIYEYDDFYIRRNGDDSKPILATLPLKFRYHTNQQYYMHIHIRNKPPSVSRMKVLRYGSKTSVADKYTHTVGDNLINKEYYFASGVLNTTEVKMKLNLYNLSNVLCSELLVVEGREASTLTSETAEEFKEYDICIKIKCVLVVDLKNKTEDSCSVRTSKTLHHISPTWRLNENYVETTTNKIGANNTNTETTNNTTVVIVCSTFGVLLALLVVIVIWKRSWFKRNPSGTPELPTVPVQERPFYTNMLFRRECDREIAEMEQHHYEEIHPR